MESSPRAFKSSRGLFFYAIDQGNIEVIDRYLRERKKRNIDIGLNKLTRVSNSQSASPLYYTISMVGYEEIAKRLLLEEDIDLELKSRMSHGYPETPFEGAVKTNEVEIAEMILKKGYTPSEREIERAIEDGNVEMLKMLRKYGYATEENSD